MHKLQNSAVEKIMIFRALQLGDLICAIPAVRALKARFPNSKITLIGLPWAVGFAKRYKKYFSDFIRFPGFAGLPEQEFKASDFMAFIRDLRKRNADLLIQMHGNGSISNYISMMSNASLLAGYCQKGGYYPDQELFMPYPDDIPEIIRHLKLMEFLGIESRGEHLEFPLSCWEENESAEIRARHELRKNEYVCIHPGARDPRRRWDTNNFVRVADEIYMMGLKVVFTGTADERETVTRVMEGMCKPAINLAGETGMGALAGLIRDSRMLFTNDTGVSHIAAAVGTPSVIIFLISDPVRWAPLNKKLHLPLLRQESEDVGEVLLKVEEVLFQEKPEEWNIQDSMSQVKALRTSHGIWG